MSTTLFGELLDLDEIEIGGDDAGASTSGDDTALVTLRERYAAGDIDEAEFERRLDALLETEDLQAEQTRDRQVAFEQ